MEPIRRSSSLPPPEQPNPFWSDRIQEDHHLEQRRPKELGGVNEPIPLDDDLDRSPQPSGSSGLVKGEESTSFRTPAVEHAPSEKPQLEEWTEKEMDDSFPPVTNGVSGKRSERAWRRRRVVGDRQYDGEHGVPTEKVEKKLEDELGDQMFFPR